VTTTQFSENVVRDQAMRAAKKKTRKYVVIGAIAAVAIIPSAAYAYMSLTGTGNAEATAYQAKNMPVSQAQFTSELWPGATADLKFVVSNPNPFPVRITDIAATGADTFNGGGCVNGANLTGKVMALDTNYTLPSADQVTVAGGGAEWVTVKDAVTLGTGATAGCGFKVAVKVTGIQTAAKN
jgi:hypothetical protein